MLYFSSVLCSLLCVLFNLEFCWVFCSSVWSRNSVSSFSKLWLGIFYRLTQVGLNVWSAHIYTNNTHKSYKSWVWFWVPVKTSDGISKKRTQISQQPNETSEQQTRQNTAWDEAMTTLGDYGQIECELMLQQTGLARGPINRGSNAH